MSRHTRNVHEWSRLEREKVTDEGNVSKSLTNTGGGIDAEHGEISGMGGKTEESGLHIFGVTGQIDEGDD